MHPKSIKRLIDALSKLPSVGSRTATRFAFYLVKTPREEVRELVEAIAGARGNIRLCFFCFNPFEQTQEKKLCGICSDPRRNKEIVCVVEKESDLIAIEQTKSYKGLFFILGGTLSPPRKESIEKIRVKELVERIKKPEKFGIEGNKDINEIIIATNFTSEGETTALYLERVLGSFGIKITRIARGLPKGGEIEYIDEETISSAFEGRK